MTQEGSHADPNRALLDERVVCDLLGFDRATYEAVRRLSAKWLRGAVRARRQGATQGRSLGYVSGEQAETFTPGSCLGSVRQL